MFFYINGCKKFVITTYCTIPPYLYFFIFFLYFAIEAAGGICFTTYTFSSFRSGVYPRSVLKAEIGKSITGFHLKIIVFTAVKYISRAFCCDPILRKGDNTKDFQSGRL